MQHFDEVYPLTAKVEYGIEESNGGCRFFLGREE